MLTYLKLMLQIVLSPSRGWDDVAGELPPARRTMLCGFLPLVLLTAMSSCISALWRNDTAVGSLVIGAVATFAVYAMTYFTCCALLNASLQRIEPEKDSDRTERVSLFASFTVGQMAVIGMLENLLPAELTLLQLLPLFEVVVIVKARAFLQIPAERTGLGVAVGIASCILPVYVFRALLSTLA